MSASPTARTLAECRKREWPAYVTEKWIPHVNVRKDAFGFGDVLVLDGKQGSLLIQACVTGSMSAREKKIRVECSVLAHEWLMAGNRIEVWGWAMRVHRRKDGTKAKTKRWTLKTKEIRL